MEKSSIQGDNQQQRLKARLGWMAGIIDGEGMITVVKAHRGHSFQPRISVSNTDLKIIEEAASISHDYKLPYYIRSISYKTNNEIRIKYELVFGGMKRCIKVLPIFIPYLIGKKDIACRLFEWCQYRLSVGRKPYDEKDDAILNIRPRIKSFQNAQRLYVRHTVKI